MVVAHYVPTLCEPKWDLRCIATIDREDQMASTAGYELPDVECWLRESGHFSGTPMSKARGGSAESLRLSPLFCQQRPLQFLD